MKQLSQIIFLSILGESAVQIIVAISTAVLLMQLFVNKIFTSKRRWIVRKKNKAMENNMWLIESRLAENYGTDILTNRPG